MQTSASYALTPPPAGAATASTSYVAYPADTASNDTVDVECEAGDILVCSGQLLISVTAGGTATLAIRVIEGAFTTDSGPKTTTSASPTLVSPYCRYTVVADGTISIKFAYRTTAGTAIITEGASNSLLVTRYYEYTAPEPEPEPGPPSYTTGEVCPLSGLYHPAAGSAGTTCAVRAGDTFPYWPVTSHVSTTWTWVAFLVQRRAIIEHTASCALFGTTCSMGRKYDPNQSYDIQLSPNPQYWASLDLSSTETRAPTATELATYGITSLSPPKVEECATLDACVSNIKYAMRVLMEADTGATPDYAPRSLSGGDLLARHKLWVLTQVVRLQLEKRISGEPAEQILTTSTDRFTALYGSDFAGVTELDRNMSLVYGRTCLMQNLARRLLQVPGSEPDDPTYGLGLGTLIGDTISKSTVALAAQEQLMQDERVTDAQVTVELDESTGALSLTCIVDDGDGPFTFTVSADGELTTDLLVLREGS